MNMSRLIILNLFEAQVKKMKSRKIPKSMCDNKGESALSFAIRTLYMYIYIQTHSHIPNYHEILICVESQIQKYLI